MDILLILSGFILSLILIVVYKRELRKPQNKVHFYVARDKSTNIIWLYLGKPIRNIVDECWIPYNRTICADYYFKYIGLDKNKYKDLKWEDEPLEVFLNLED